MAKQNNVYICWVHGRKHRCTLTGKNNVSDDVYEEVLQQFSEEELVDLTMAVIAINSWNRINIAFRTPAGDYTPGQHAVLSN